MKYLLAEIHSLWINRTDREPSPCRPNIEPWRQNFSAFLMNAHTLSNTLMEIAPGAPGLHQTRIS